MKNSERLNLSRGKKNSLTGRSLILYLSNSGWLTKRLNSNFLRTTRSILCSDMSAVVYEMVSSIVTVNST